jgi:NADH-quinone oxidoreductase subunit C
MPRKISQEQESRAMSQLPVDIETRFRSAAPRGIAFSETVDSFGVTNAWCELGSKEDLKPVAQVLRSLGARLSLMTGSQPPPAPEPEDGDEAEDADPGDADVKTPARSFGGTPMDGTSYELTYHFDIAGDTLTVVAFIPKGESIASLTPLFRTANWPEREIMETYTLVFTDHPDPRRLFIDETIEPSILEQLIPFSTLVNAGSTAELWAKVTDVQKAGVA